MVIFMSFRAAPPPVDDVVVINESKYTTITGVVEANETLESIFNKNNLDRSDMHKIYTQSRDQYNLSKISVGNMYSFTLSKEGNILEGMEYAIDDMSFLSVLRNPEGFSAEKVILPVTRRAGSFYIQIKGNLMSSMPGTHREYMKLALALADIYAWDIDLSSDIREGDSVKLLVEELWTEDVFRGYGNILAAEFINNGTSHRAYRFDHDGYVDYYDEKGRSLRKSLLRSPLRFKYISSGFTRKRFHPILRKYRPHLGIDYAAPTGTPVSAAGSGTVMYSGYKGQYGRMVKIKHPGGYITYYGHLSRIPKKIRKNRKVSQGDIIGYVGSTGLSTGPHLDYRIKLNGKFVNPLKINLPRGKSVPKTAMARFRQVSGSLEEKLASIARPVLAMKVKKKKEG